jgi:hypothetical protein
MKTNKFVYVTVFINRTLNVTSFHQQDSFLCFFDVRMSEYSPEMS